MLIKMRPSSPKLAILARELAYRPVELSFPPDAVHTPGLAHVIADKLSRVHALGRNGRVKGDIHLAMAQAEETTSLVKNSAWHRAYRQ